MTSLLLPLVLRDGGTFPVPHSHFLLGNKVLVSKIPANNDVVLRRIGLTTFHRL